MKRDVLLPFWIAGVWGVFFWFLVLMSHCQPTPSPGPPLTPDAPPPPEEPVHDATPPRPQPPGPSASPCALAYYHLATGLACEPPKPAGSGTWTDVCEVERAHAHSFGLDCIARATTCDAARRCLAGAR